MLTQDTEDNAVGKKTVSVSLVLCYVLKNKG